MATAWYNVQNRYMVYLLFQCCILSVTPHTLGGESMAICCFCGHGDASDTIRPALARLIEEHIRYFGITEFWVGNYGRFDRMACSLVCSAKKNHPEIRLCLLLPYIPTQQTKDEMDYPDEIIVPSVLDNVPRRVAIPKLNKYMVDQSDYMIACVSHISNGAYKTLEYARKQEKNGQIHITNIQSPHEAL